jgi:hypothetical protein
MGVLMPLRRGLVLWPAVLALASVAPRARMPYGNVGDGRLDVLWRRAPAMAKPAPSLRPIPQAWCT